MSAQRKQIESSLERALCEDHRASDDRSESKEKGFSLVELMVVLLIIGLTAGVVVMTMPPDEDTVLDEAADFGHTLTRISQQSILSGRMVGLKVTAEGYRFYRLSKGKWVLLEKNRSFTPANWDDGTQVGLSRAGAKRRDDPPGNDDEGKKKIVPDVIFDPIGMVTPVRLIFERDGQQVFIDLDGAGETKIIDPMGR